VIAHRGASGHAPENTLSAFLLAIQMGADGVELDVHLTADGEVVVLHNDTVEATTDGHGHVGHMSLRELQALDAGSWYDSSHNDSHDGAHDARYTGERIPTLAQVFEALGHRALINVEIKAQRGRAAQERPRGQLEAAVVRLIEDHHMSQQVLVSSFSPGSLRRVHQLCPDLPLGFLFAPMPGRPSRLLLRLIRAWVAPYDALHPTWAWVDAARAAWARRLDLPLNVWTVNHRDDMRPMRDLGVAGIITNYPDRLIDILQEQPGTSPD
jgi:glycerophosphoryl diester phosphodiesterase